MVVVHNKFVKCPNTTHTKNHPRRLTEPLRYSILIPTRPINYISRYMNQRFGGVALLTSETVQSTENDIINMIY